MLHNDLFHSVTEFEQYIQSYPTANALYSTFKPDWKMLVQDYFLSKRTLPLTYDPFFKRIFNTDIHPDRLSRLISAIMGQPVTVTATLSNKDVLIKGNALLIMDIVVRLADGSITTVEIQKLATAFPAERMSCYSADLLLRQYEQVKNELLERFNYDALNKVYTIVIFENTDAESSNAPVYRAFHTPETNQLYLHHGKTVFDTGLQIDLLQEFYLISLDVFRNVGYAKDEQELTAWLSLLCVSTYEEAEALCLKYPWMEEIFEEISEYVHNPEEVIGMFSEALQKLDENMYQYMADQHRALLKQRQEQLEQVQLELQDKQQELQDKQQELQDKQLELQDKQLELQQEQQKLQGAKQELHEKQHELDDKDSEIASLKKELAHMQALLNSK